MSQPEQMADLVSQGGFEIECAVGAISRELLKRIQNNVGLGNKAFAIVKDAGFSRLGLWVP